MNKCVVTIVFFLFLFSCNRGDLTNWFCGSLSDEQQAMIESSKIVCGDNCRIEHIPCEYNYVKLYLESAKVDSSLIRKVHKKLFNNKTNEGWPSIMIYSKEGSYIISHGQSGKFYKQHGD
jgi:hypothetical protein